MSVRPIINPDAPQIPKRDPQISFTESTVDIDEKYLKGNYTFNWTKYLVNSDNVGYTIKLSEGIVFVDEDTIKWSDSGIYTLTLTTIEDKIFNSIDIVLTLNITTLDTSGVEYVPNPLEIVDGDLQIEYFNIEKREGVYMFDLIKPNNPNSLTINYKIEGKHGCTIDLDDAKVHIAKKGKYKITAYFDGNTSYRPSSTVYYLVYGKDGEEDDKDPYDPETPTTKKYPNISFSKSSVIFDKISTDIYEVLQVNNPYSVPVKYNSDKGNIFDGNSKIQLEEGFEGNIKITCTSEETATYYSQSVSYILTVEIPESEKSDDYVFEFIQESDNKTLNSDGEYDILTLNNPLGLEYTLVVSKPASISPDKTKILCSIDGTYIVTATSIGGSLYKNKQTSYTLTLTKSDKETPVFSFIKTQDTQQKTEEGKYIILALDNPNSLEYNITCNNDNARIEDNYLIFNDLGTITITATSKETDEYVSVSTYYILYIIKSSKQNPNISFTYERINVPFNDDITVGYDIQLINNPNNVELTDYYTSSGTITSNKLYNITSPTELYIQVLSVEDENYYAATARYTLNIYKQLLKWPNFRVHDDYSLIDKLDLTKNIELLRWPKSDNLVFDASEWRVSSSKGICVVNNLTMTETEDDCILYADIKFSQEGNVRINITFNGNAEWQSANNMGFYINYKKPELLSPDLSFPSYYVIQDKSTNNTYLIQEVLNPYSVPVNYYVSNGNLDGNILTYPDTGNVVITCTSNETDIYKSQSVQYTLHINEPKKLSPELSFTNSLEEYEQGTYPNNEYPLQTLNNPHNVPIKEWKATNNAIVYATNGQVVKYNYSGDVIVSVTSRETSVYASETVYYTLRIVESSSLLDPELYYSPNSGAVYVNSEGIYTIPLPHIADSTLPLTFSTENGLGTISSDGTTLSVSGTWNVRIYAKFAGNSIYRAAQADYVLRISEAPEKPYPDIRFLYSTVSGDSNTSNGVYDLQTTFVGAQSDIGGEYFISYNDARVDNSTKKLYYNGTSASITVYYRTNETSEYKSALLYYDMWISAQPLQYLEGELINTNIGVSGAYNTDILIPLVKIKKEKNLAFNASEWTITTDKYSCTPKVVSITSFDTYYDVLNISVSFSQEDTAPLRIRFLGNSQYYSQSDFSIVYVSFTKGKISPNYYFEESIIRTTGKPGGKYKLPKLLNVPSSLNVSLETSTWQANIVDGYLYYNGDGFVRVTASNTETSEYEAYSTHVDYIISGAYEKFVIDATIKERGQNLVNQYWNPNNEYIFELVVPDYYFDDPTSEYTEYIDWENIIWTSDIPITRFEYVSRERGTGVYSLDYILKYKVSFVNNNIYSTGTISDITFTIQETDYYQQVTETKTLNIQQYTRQDLSYTKHEDYTYTDIPLGYTVNNVLLLEYDDAEHVLSGDDGSLFTVEVVPNMTELGGVKYMVVSNIRYTGGEVKCDITFWNHVGSGNNDIYIKYKGNTFYNPLKSSSNVVNVSFTVDSQYIKENVIYFDENTVNVEQNICGNNLYDIQEVKYTYTSSTNPTVYFESPVEWVSRPVFDYKIYADHLGNYTITAYTNNQIIDNVLYKATRIQYTFILTPDNNYYEDGSIYFIGDNPQIVDENVEGEYALQGIVNPNLWTLEYECVPSVGESFSITDGYIHYNDVGLLTIYARTVGVYPKRQAHYQLLIREDSRLDPGISVIGSTPLTVSYLVTHKYNLLPISNPNNVSYTITSSKGTVINNILNYNGSYPDEIDITITTIADENYRSKTITYKVNLIENNKIIDISKIGNECSVRADGNIVNGIVNYPWMSYKARIGRFTLNDEVKPAVLNLDFEILSQSSSIYVEITNIYTELVNERAGWYDIYVNFTFDRNRYENSSNITYRIQNNFTFKIKQGIYTSEDIILNGSLVFKYEQMSITSVSSNNIVYNSLGNYNFAITYLYEYTWPEDGNNGWPMYYDLVDNNTGITVASKQQVIFTEVNRPANMNYRSVQTNLNLNYDEFVRDHHQIKILVYFMPVDGYKISYKSSTVTKPLDYIIYRNMVPKDLGDKSSRGNYIYFNKSQAVSVQSGVGYKSIEDYYKGKTTNYTRYTYNIPQEYRSISFFADSMTINCTIPSNLNNQVSFTVYVGEEGVTKTSKINYIPDTGYYSFTKKPVLEVDFTGN